MQLYRYTLKLDEIKEENLGELFRYDSVYNTGFINDKENINSMFKIYFINEEKFLSSRTVRDEEALYYTEPKDLKYVAKIMEKCLVDKIDYMTDIYNIDMHILKCEIADLKLI